MSRHRLCKACGEFHNIDEMWPLACLGDAESRRSHLSAPAIRPDGMDAMVSHATGRMHDSKSAYYRELKDNGCVIVGDDRSGFGRQKTVDDLVPKNIGQDIKRSIEQLSGRAA